MFVQQVSGSVKGPLNVTLGAKTLIVGPNGAGKTRVANALELALSGCARDIEGKAEVRDAATLISLAPADEPLHALCRLDDGRGAAFRIERKAKGKLSRPEHAPIENLRVIFPAQEALAALRGSTAKARAFVLRLGTVPSAVTDAALTERVKAPLREMFAAVYGAVVGDDPVERLLAAREQIQTRIKNVRAEIKGAQAVLDNLRANGGFSLAAPADPAEALARREQAQAALDLWNAELRALRAPTRPVAAPQVTEDQILAAHAHLSNVTQQYHAAHAAYSAHASSAAPAAVEAPAASPALPLLGAIETMLGAFVPYAGHTLACPVCQQAWAVPDVTPRIAQTRQAVADAEGATAAGRAASAEADRQIQAHADEGARLLAAVQLTHAEASALTASYQALCERFQNVTGPSADELAAFEQAQADYTGRCDAAEKAIAIAMNDRTAADMEIRQTHTQQANRQAAQTAADTVAGREAEERDLTALADSVAEVISLLTSEARQGFVAAVQTYLPKSDTFDVVLQRGDSEVCAFGFVRDGALHTALSGAEQARLAMALGAVLAQHHKADLAVILPEERSYDPETLAATMRALTAAPAQIIITSPIAPKGKTPAGWTVIKIGKDGLVEGEGAPEAAPE